MKKILLFLFIFSNQSFIFSQSVAFTETKIILSVNGTADTYYDLSANSSDGNQFQNNGDLGTFEEGASTLTLQGVEHKVSKCNGGDVHGSELYYRIYPYGSASGSFTNVDGNGGYMTTSWVSNDSSSGGCDYQTWRKTNGSVNLLSGLSNGRYVIEVYGRGWGSAEFYDNNSGNNYKANFRIGSFTSSDGDWSTASIWTGSAVPANTDNVVINNDITISSDITSKRVEVKSGNNLTINAGASLTTTEQFKNWGNLIIESSSSDSGSIIAESQAGGGTNKYKKYVASSATADLISAPFAGETFSNLLSNNSGMIIFNPSDSTEYLFSTFDNESSGDYSNFDSDTDGSTTIDAGSGYRSGTNSKATDLFFSQYGEGSGNNKYLEIFNATGAAVDLSAYDVQIHFNGNTSSSNGNIKDLGTGTLANNDVLVVVHTSSSNGTLQAAADINATIGFNGDDSSQYLFFAPIP